MTVVSVFRESVARTFHMAAFVGLIRAESAALSIPTAESRAHRPSPPPPNDVVSTEPQLSPVILAINPHNLTIFLEMSARRDVGNWSTVNVNFPSGKALLSYLKQTLSSEENGEAITVREDGNASNSRTRRASGTMATTNKMTNTKG